MKYVVVSALLLFSGTAVRAQAPYPAAPARSSITKMPVAPAARVTSGYEMLLAVRQNWRAGQWRDTTRNRYTRYDANSNNLERYVEDIDATGAWARRNRRTNTYNLLNQRVRDTIFSNLNNPVFAFRRSYLTSGQPDSVVVQLRLGGTWRNASRDIYTYDAAGHPLGLLQQNSAGGWYNFARYTYTTDAAGRIVADEEEYFDDNTGTWGPSSQLEYTYTAADSLATAVYSEFAATSGSYEYVGRSRYRYTTLGLLDSIYNEPYDALTGTFSLGNIAVYTYDARANRLSETIKVGASLSALTNLSQWVYSYRLTLGRADDVPLTAAFAVTPNPAAGAATVRYELRQPATVGVEVLDVLGRRVAGTPNVLQLAGVHTAPLDLAGLRPGLYVVSLTSNGRRQQARLVVE